MIKIDFLDNYLNKIASNPEKYDIELLLSVAKYSKKYNRKILDYLFEKTLYNENIDIELFKYDLIYHDLYFNYINDIFKGDDDYLKACVILYFDGDYREKIYKNNIELANSIINANIDRDLKLTNLVNISQFICDEETTMYIKRNFEKLIFENNNDDFDDYKENLCLLYKLCNVFDQNQFSLEDEKKLQKKN